MSSFGCYEPSEELLMAMKSRMSNKAYGDTSGAAAAALMPIASTAGGAAPSATSAAGSFGGFQVSSTGGGVSALQQPGFRVSSNPLQQRASAAPGIPSDPALLGLDLASQEASSSSAIPARLISGVGGASFSVGATSFSVGGGGPCGSAGAGSFSVGGGVGAGSFSVGTGGGAASFSVGGGAKGCPASAGAGTFSVGAGGASFGVGSFSVGGGGSAGPASGGATSFSVGSGAVGGPSAAGAGTFSVGVRGPGGGSAGSADAHAAVSSASAAPLPAPSGAFRSVRADEVPPSRSPGATDPKSKLPPTSHTGHASSSSASPRPPPVGGRPPRSPLQAASASPHASRSGNAEASSGGSNLPSIDGAATPDSPVSPGGVSQPRGTPTASAAAASRPPSGRGPTPSSARPPTIPESPTSPSPEVKSSDDDPGAAAMEAAAAILAAARSSQESLEEKEARIHRQMKEALAHASADPGVRALPALSSVPSALTIGGVPVAMDGNMVYLGAGVYACADPPKEPAPKARARKPERRRVLPGRVNAPPPRRNGGRRSASAHALGSVESAASSERSPSPSRALSEGKMGETGCSDLSNLIEAATGKKRGDPKVPQAAPGEKAWRPSGAAKLPPAAPEEQRKRRSHQPLAPGEEVPRGAHAEARAEHRNEMRNKGLQHFNAQSMMQELHANDPYGLLGNMPGLMPVQPPAEEPPRRTSAVSGPPMNGVVRKEERKALKEARVQAMLEARAERMEMERQQRAAAKRLLGARSLHRGAMGSASAPNFGTTMDSDMMDGEAHPAEELEKQKMRVACKMEILDFFKGYSQDVSKMTEQQKRQLLAKLNGGAPEQDLADSLHTFEQQRQQKVEEWIHKSQVVEDEHTIHKRLAQVNDLCNKAFDAK